MPLILGTNSVKGGYEVANSMRFNVGSSDRLTRTFDSGGSQQKFTISCWVKNCEPDYPSDNAIFANYVDNSNFAKFGFQGDNNQLRFFSRTSGSTDCDIQLSAMSRDPSAWQHFVMGVDTTQGTSSNRIKIYVNGVQQTSFVASTYPSQNANLHFNNAISHEIASWNNSQFFDGYLTEFCFLNNVQLAPTSFGEFDEDSPTIWKPISLSDLTFGTNGFYLDFETDDTPGNDVSGNDNDFANSNLTSVDQSTDTCTNNFATMNPLAMGSNITISEGNLKVSNGNSDNSVLGTIGLANGKFYWEAKCTGATTYANIGVTLASAVGVTHSNVDAGRVVYSHNGYVYKEGLSGQSNVSGLATFTTNDIISVAFDAQNGSVKFYKNGTLINTTTDNDLLFSNNEYITAIGINQGGFELNFGSPPYSISSGNSDANGHGNFEYSVPSGYFALCTKNLAENG
tara:strand:+ start:127 stop:1491 length:1365 start_codon:yes stop_codon:yes gene_type:complete